MDQGPWQFQKGACRTQNAVAKGVEELRASGSSSRTQCGPHVRFLVFRVPFKRPFEDTPKKGHPFFLFGVLGDSWGLVLVSTDGTITIRQRRLIA